MCSFLSKNTGQVRLPHNGIQAAGNNKTSGKLQSLGSETWGA